MHEDACGDLPEDGTGRLLYAANADDGQVECQSDCVPSGLHENDLSGLSKSHRKLSDTILRAVRERNFPNRMFAGKH